MHRDDTSNGLAAVIAILMVGLAVAMGWLIVSGTVFPSTNPLLSGPLAEAEVITIDSPELIEGMRIESAVQFSQPRDPFRPLITEPSDEEDGTTDTTTPDDQTDGISVTLQEIRDVNGTLRATVIVDGVTYDVGVDDVFATTFRVISLDTDSGVFMNGDNVFTLSTGQQILK